jgi:hybrid polyketide synthase / nonribosomal peptide synthetase ACE1
MYTDVSAGLFEKAAENFADHVHKMDFKTFNAENPPAEQGFTEGSYDIIIAVNVLHATRKLSQTRDMPGLCYVLEAS